MSVLKITPVVIIVASFALGMVLYPYLPDFLATHWNTAGIVDGYSSKPFGLFFLPCLLVGLYFLFTFLPKTDPYRKNFQSFQNYFYGFINIVFVFLLYLYLLVLIWNLGFGFDFIKTLSPAFALLFIFAGHLMAKTKRNWFVGIRTPWTLANATVWEKTHELGSKLFLVSGIITLLGYFFPSAAFYLLFGSVLLSTLAVFVYSYLEYRKIKSL